MKTVILVFLLLISGVVQAQLFQPIEETPLMVEFESAKNEQQLFKSQLDEVCLFRGYLGLSYMVLARLANNDYSKLKYFFLGREYIDMAVKQAPKNVELRFLRFSVQENAPTAIPYHENMEEDKAILIQHILRQKEDVITSKMKDFLLNSESLTKKEKRIIQRST